MSQKRVIILGGGVAGKALAMSQAKAGHKVIVVEPDSLGRPMQSRQLHVMLAGGMELLQRWFPQTVTQLQKHCPRTDWGGDSLWISPVGEMPRTNVGVVTHTSSRAFLDGLMAEEMADVEIEWVREKVTGIEMRGDRVSEVCTSQRRLSADIVIDAMGRSSKMPGWLEKLDRGCVGKTHLPTSLRYLTRVGNFQEGCSPQQVYAQIDPQKSSHGGVILPIEQGRVIVTGVSIEKPEGEGFSAVDDSIFQHHIEKIDFEPECRVFGQMHNTLYHYHSFKGLPKNLFIVGDGVCQFNPVFGQGMTQALRGVAILETHLASDAGPSLGFQRKLKRDLRFPWLMATMDPYCIKTRLRLGQRLMRWWVHKQMRYAQSDERYRTRLIKVLHMLDSPTRLYRPQGLWGTILS